MMCFDEWNACILANCGQYHGRPIRAQRGAIGDFRLRQRHGVDIAEIRCRIERIDRQRAGIRQDDREYLFLLMQRSGETLVTHNGRQEMLAPGDCLLMDSMREAELNFQGRDSAMTSVHLPRALCLEGRGALPLIGHRLAASHPLAVSLAALISEGPEDEGLRIAGDYVFDFVAMVFRPQNRPGGAAAFRDRDGRFRLACDTIETHLSDPDFSIERLAALVNMSRRQLQRDFSDHGTTFTHFLAERRSRLIADHLRRAAALGRRPVIAELAFRAGFSDLSHFNRVFRHHYGMTPCDYYATHGPLC
ncbi:MULTISPECIES: helix-turn-helix domain-containing protein [unclassified Paracoccus (in: a-proteobacteria)]|uniref:helix-turn-helix domain-containing protein n=1 Tax=unclassified Paracoccus (in: a-proteobacteria) TaxID=2688777 RepID=UPI0018A6AD32|nr:MULTISPECIES: helix-turn-helix domain-containing protein [unclassified Paracoccus (in: a-proteobacteria)]UXU76431.1 helix-turn-helix domain-containing protein [Paracoccus sp. SMMA_5]UXU82231.1 helix-turn-helix domain-containing protein [Paracoccus sp. SMMA_5_TC]